MQFFAENLHFNIDLPKNSAIIKVEMPNNSAKKEEEKMSKIKELEPLVEHALITNPEARKDNFILYVEVLKRYINMSLPIQSVFMNHKALGIPSLESITRCRRKIQERNSSLKNKNATAIRSKEEEEHRNYGLADKQWF